ncbi:unnamed protein product [Arctia plantaginis]|uniref:Uncharacterized protein n=1 Tax=Arctia plantaginis TaxID=874455 RepID=A0A8S0ZCN4_ARCPL|nr:unnamed protein product [Arctia plantaginis]
MPGGKQSTGVNTDEEILRIREAKLRVIADRIGLRRLHIFAPRLRKLILDGSAIGSLRELGIGLTRLKILSINRCNLTSLDGIWGLGSLREMYAAGNRLQDLQPLAVLQKLHTLDLANNPIAEFSRLWTLGVCGSLRRMTLQGTPASDMPDYRSAVATALPMLVYLDERPLHVDIDYESSGELGETSSSDSDAELENDAQEAVLFKQPSDEPTPGPSSSEMDIRNSGQDGVNGQQELAALQKKRSILRSRPATTENAGVRPTRPELPPRPRTAHDRPVIDEHSRLQILSTLMDDEWLSSGSKLTSVDAMCGNLANALRRTTSNTPRSCKDDDDNQSLLQDTMTEALKSVAEEIPRAPNLEDWLKFKENTGIDIDINLNERQECPDASKILERLEQIERETQERYKGAPSETGEHSNFIHSLPNVAFHSIPTRSDYELWNDPGSSHSQFMDSDINTFFNKVSEIHSVDREGRFRVSRNNNRQTE